MRAYRLQPKAKTTVISAVTVASLLAGVSPFQGSTTLTLPQFRLSSTIKPFRQRSSLWSNTNEGRLEMVAGALDASKEKPESTILTERYQAGIEPDLGPDVLRNSTDKFIIVPSAAELIAAAEEGRIIATNILDPDYQHASNQMYKSAEHATNMKTETAAPLIEIPSKISTQSTNKKPLSSPGLSKIFKFAIPAIGVWLCGPILSLIDTSSVGLLAGTAHQAALSPAVAVTEYSALLLAFLYTGTTNLVAAANEVDGDDATKPKSARNLIASLQLSLWVGISFGAVLLALSRPLLKALIGNDTLDPVVFETALKYVRIRALGMPAGTVIGSAQAACMGMQDVKAPLYVLAAAAIVNLMGDILLVGSQNPWFGGAAGAAWATVFSQFAALSLFMNWLTTRTERATNAPPRDVEAANNILPIKVSGAMSTFTNSIKKRVSSSPVENKLRPTKKHYEKTYGGRSTSQIMKAAIANLEQEVRLAKRKAAISAAKTKKSFPIVTHFKSIKQTFANRVASIKARKDEKKAEATESFSSKGFLYGRFTPSQLLKLPNKEVAKEFLPYVMPITSTSVGRVSSYVAMSHVISSALGTGAMAAQQVIISIFYCLTPIADSLNLTAQSLLPAIYEKPKGTQRATALKNTLREFLQAGVLFGGILVTLVSMIPSVSRMFTADPLVIAQIKSVIPFLAGSFIGHGLICAMEGCMLGQKDLHFLGKSYVSYFVGVPFFMLRVKKAALSGATGIGLTSVWKVFMGYQFVRMAMFVTRVLHLGNKATQDTSDTPLIVAHDVGINSVVPSLNELDAVVPSNDDNMHLDFNSTAAVFA